MDQQERKRKRALIVFQICNPASCADSIARKLQISKQDWLGGSHHS